MNDQFFPRGNPVPQQTKVWNLTWQILISLEEFIFQTQVKYYLKSAIKPQHQFAFKDI